MAFEPKPDKKESTEPGLERLRKPRSYYYDDACGYEDYDPELDANEESDEAEIESCPE
ncbi:MAG TPA: hypothetical protein PKD26_01910 [Pyrinomonadaceae bacterium]|nr:hypothetical protein [Pyrinomonadaceae bacterium]